MKLRPKPVAINDDDLILAVLYLRMSTDKQDTSIQAQRDRVYAFFKGKYRVIEEYIDEGKSGSKDTEKRTDFLRMVKDLTTGKHKGKVKVALCLDLSRFGRLDTIEGAEEKKQLRKAGVKLDTVIDGLIDWNTATGRIVDSVKSEGNHQLSLLIAEKGLQGRIRVTQEGKPNQTTPYGMAKKVTSPTGEIIIIKRGQRFAKPKSWDSEFIPGDPDEVAAVRFMFEMFDREDITYRELARRLQEKGFPCPSGHSRATQGAITGWRYDTVQWMLRNPVYVGCLRIGEVPKGEFFRTFQGHEKAVYSIYGTTDPVIAKDVHQGIIDRQLFDRVQAKYRRNLESNERRSPRRVGPYSLSPGIIHCGQCGQPMYGQKADFGDKNRTIYLCHRGQANASCKCGSWIAYEKDILPLIVNNFFRELTNELEAQQPERSEHAEEAARLERQLAGLDKKLETARENFLLASKAIAPGLMKRIEAMESERVDLAARLRVLQAKGGGNRALEWWRKFQAEIFGGLLPVSEVFVTSPDQDHRPGLPDTIRAESVRVTLDIPPAVLREKLLKLDLRVFVWFARKPKGQGMGWNLDKVRITANVGRELIFEYSAPDPEGDPSNMAVDESSNAAS